MPNGVETGTVATYLAARLVELGIEHLFNVSGSYCSGLLKALADGRLVKPVFTTYELEAAYAADAYARLRGFGAMCGTYGVGALSALNAVTGAFVERCPIVVINGGPSQAQLDLQIEYGVMFLHSTGPLKTDLAAYSQITAAAVVIDAASEAPGKIDEALTACMEQRRPVYIEIGQNVWTQPCPMPQAKLVAPAKPENAAAVSECLAEVLERLRSAKQPIIWAGEELQRWDLQDTLAQLLRKSRIPFVTTLAGKSLLPETADGFLGVYDGRFATPQLQKIVQQADLVLAFGTTVTDFIGDVVVKDYGSMILATQGGVRIGNHLYPDVTLSNLVAALKERLTESAIAPSWATAPVRPTPSEPAADATITFDRLFNRVGRFVSDKLVIADTGLSLFASADLTIPSRDGYISQSVWMSIGYSLGASVGTAYATGKRPVVFVGDAAFREGPQAISTLVDGKVPAVIFVMDNGIMGIQQFMGDPDFYTGAGTKPDYYNVLARWDYPALARGFGARHAYVKTVSDLDLALLQAEGLTDVPIVIDVVLEATDIPDVIRQAIGRTAPEPVQANFEAPLISRAAS